MPRYEVEVTGVETIYGREPENTILEFPFDPEYKDVVAAMEAFYEEIRAVDYNVYTEW